MPIASAAGLLADIRSRPAWDGAIVEPEDSQFPRLTVDCHEGQGLVLHCWEDETSWSDLLVTSREFSTPSVEVELGGQALERWPRELFSSTARATQAIEYFLEHGTEDPTLEWVRIDGFPREILWEGRVQQKAWERAQAAQRRESIARSQPASWLQLANVRDATQSAGADLPPDVSRSGRTRSCGSANVG